MSNFPIRFRKKSIKLQIWRNMTNINGNSWTSNLMPETLTLKTLIICASVSDLGVPCILIWLSLPSLCPVLYLHHAVFSLHSVNLVFHLSTHSFSPVLHLCSSLPVWPSRFLHTPFITMPGTSHCSIRSFSGNRREWATADSLIRWKYYFGS